MSQSNFPECNTLVEILRWRAQYEPEHRAYTFLLDGENDTAHLTHAELDQKARRIAAELQQAGAYGERVLLLYPPGLEYLAAFFGCLYAGAIAVPAYPPSLNKPAPRIQAIIADAGPRIALTLGGQLAKLQAWFARNQPLQWLATDEIVLGAENWRKPDIDGDTIAFLQYTSGSTATPRGVMVTHRNLLHNLSLIRECFGHTRASQGVIWLPPYHDMGLIGGALQPLYAGFPVTLMSPTAFLSSPIRWLRAITRYRGTTSGGPNFAFDLCVRRISAEQRATLDLTSWDVAFNGAEPIRAETLERFTATFAPCGFRREAFYPCYGLAEATLLVTGGEKLRPPRVCYFSAADLEHKRVTPTAVHVADSRALVGCGASLRGEKLLIVNTDEHVECAPDEIGEIWVSGPSVAGGYWNRATETEETFGANLGNGKFLRTGDLGFLQEGVLFVAGRLKDLIIIRGRNHYPQDIEQTVESSHPALEPSSGAAFSIEVAGEEKLIVVNELKRLYRKADVLDIVRAVRAAVSMQHELQVYAIRLLKPASVPRTSSGKIQRYAARSAFLSNTLNVVGAWDLNETIEPSAAEARISEPRLRELVVYLRTQIANKLEMKESAIDPSQSLASLGLDSLAIIELKLQIGQDLAVNLDEVDLAQAPTLMELARWILQMRATVTRRAGAKPRGHATVPTRRIVVERVLSPIVNSLWKISGVGVENIPAGGAYLLCPNHESYLDPLWVGAALPASIRHRLTWMAMREAFENPLMRPVATQMGPTISVDRLGNPAPAMRRARELLQTGQPLVIFPEGTMTRTGALGTFRRGAAWLALATGAPIIPVRIEGAYEVYAPVYLLPRVYDFKEWRRMQVRVTFGAPILPPRASGRDAEIRLTNQLRDVVIALGDK